MESMNSYALFLKHCRREGVQSFILGLSYHFDYKNLYLMYFELHCIFYSWQIC